MAKLTKVNTGGNNNSFAGCVLTGVCASAADAYVKQVTLTDGDALSDGMGMVVTFANGNTVGTAPDSLTIYSSDQVNYYEDAQLTVPFTLAPQGCYTIEYTGTANAYTYISFPVLQVGNITAPVSDNTGHIVSADLWAAGDAVHVIYSSGKFMLQLQPVSVVDVVQAQNMSPVTSNAVAGAVANAKQEIQAVESSLPTDAVLHYSFDEVPDYPDGSAVYFRNRNFASDDVSGDCTKTYTNGVLTLTNGTYAFIILSATNPIEKITLKATTDCTIMLYQTGGSGNKQVTLKAGVIQDFVLSFSGTIASVGISGLSGVTLDVYAIYIGNGSYTTPVIDNANGQNNATNNGGVAVQGLSGKGVYFPSAGYRVTIPTANLPAPTSNDNFAISVWINFSTDYTGDSTSSYKPIVTIGSFTGSFGLFRSQNGLGIICRDSVSSRAYVTTMKKGQWCNYVLVYDGTTHTCKLFENGVLLGSTVANIANYQFGSGASDWKIWSNEVIGGNASTTTNQPATLDDILIFNRALSQEEVTALYLNKANTPKYYNLNDYKLPAPPSTDGVYNLQCSVVNGVPAYNWDGYSGSSNNGSVTIDLPQGNYLVEVDRHFQNSDRGLYWVGITGTSTINRSTIFEVPSGGFTFSFTNGQLTVSTGSGWIHVNAHRIGDYG